MHVFQRKQGLCFERHVLKKDSLDNRLLCLLGFDIFSSLVFGRHVLGDNGCHSRVFSLWFVASAFKVLQCILVYIFGDT